MFPGQKLGDTWSTFVDRNAAGAELTPAPKHCSSALTSHSRHFQKENGIRKAPDEKELKHLGFYDA